jgi:propanediol utilization protein
MMPHVNGRIVAQRHIAMTGFLVVGARLAGVQARELVLVQVVLVERPVTKIRRWVQTQEL